VDGLRVIRQGLRAGESVVVNGLQRVRAGQTVAASHVPMDADRVGLRQIGSPSAPLNAPAPVAPKPVSNAPVSNAVVARAG
jgi:hypothetical protein